MLPPAWLAQGSPGAVVEPFAVPCCGSIALAVVIGVLVVATMRRIPVDQPSQLPEPPPGHIEYATPRARPRRKAIWPGWVRRAVVILIVAFIVGVIGWFAWDFRTRETAIQLIDGKTGRPITITPSLVYADDNGPGFSSSVSYPSPGTVDVTWNHPCTIAIQIAGYSDISPNGVVSVDDQTPPVIQMRIDPK